MILKTKLECIFTLSLPVFCQEQSKILAAEQDFKPKKFVASRLPLVYLSTRSQKTTQCPTASLQERAKTLQTLPNPYLARHHQQLPDAAAFQQQYSLDRQRIGDIPWWRNEAYSWQSLLPTQIKNETQKSIRLELNQTAIQGFEVRKKLMFRRKKRVSAALSHLPEIHPASQRNLLDIIIRRAVVEEESEVFKPIKRRPKS